MYISIYIAINERWGHEFKESKERYVEGLKVEKERERCYIIVFEIKKKLSKEQI